MKIKYICIAILGILPCIGFSQTDSTQQLRVEYKIYHEMPLDNEDAQMRDAIKKAMEKATYHELIMNRDEAMYKSIPTISNDQPTDDGFAITFEDEEMKKYYNIQDSIVLEPISWPEEYIIKEPLVLKKWELSREQKEVCGFPARKATFHIQDSIEVVAWYVPKLHYSFGPIGYYGLPGLIVELEETLTYKEDEFKRKVFCNTVEVLSKPQPLEKPTKGKVVTTKEMEAIWDEINQKIDDMYGNTQGVDTGE